MGIWSWLKGAFSKGGGPGADRGVFPELVMLIEDPIGINAKFIRDAVLDRLEVSLSVDEPGSSDFVTGEYPIFVIQYEGRLIQLKFMHIPYFDPAMRPFLNADPAPILRSVTDKRTLEAIGRHKGWIAVSLMRTPDDLRSEDPYVWIGNILFAFCGFETTAIIWPNQQQIRPWTDEMIDLFIDERPLDIFAK